jgi:tRNA threonylcarbamoyladenosine biosynthesis protein TsaB
MIAVIDTSTAYSALALVREDTLLAEQQWLGGRNHSEQVLSQLDTLCRLVQVTAHDITTIAVTLGPGSWSGIRVGISIAKGIAIANHAQIVGVGTLDSMAWTYRQHEAVSVCTSLGRGRFAVADYPRDWEPGQVHPHNMAVADITFTRAVVCDTPTWRMCGQPQPWYANPARPLHVAQIATHILKHGDLTPPTIEPIYLGDPVQPPA